MRHYFALLFIVGLLSCQFAKAYVELGGTYSSETLKTATTTTNGRTIVDFCLGFPIDNKGTYMLGWNYMSHTTTDVATVTTTYSATHMGPRLLVNLGKGKNWQVGFSYLLVTNGKFNNGVDAEATLEGTAMKFDFGYGFELLPNLKLALRVNYLTASFAESLTNGTTYTQVSYAKTTMYPGVHLVWAF